LTPESALQAIRQRTEIGPAPGTPLSFLRAGTPGAARLILIHGTPGSASGWADYLVDPPPGIEVMALDRPGFGESGPKGPVTSLAAQADAVATLLPADGRPVVLLGHSLGGPVAAMVAARYPERIHALVLLSASLDPAQEHTLKIQRLGDWPPVRAMLPRTIRNANAELMALKTELESLATLLPLIRAKVVIVHGAQDDLVPVANVPYMQSQLTGARCLRTVLLESGNHFLPWNSVADVRAAVTMALEDGC
jgi:pimeloyl-ACP methyl ester carboxylesterase